MCSSPAQRLPDTSQVSLRDAAALRLEQRPRQRQAHDVHAKRCDVREVLLGQRLHRRQRRIAVQILAELVDVHAAQRDARAGGVHELRPVHIGAHGQRRQAVAVACGRRSVVEVHRRLTGALPGKRASQLDAQCQRERHAARNGQLPIGPAVAAGVGRLLKQAGRHRDDARDRGHDQRERRRVDRPGEQRRQVPCVVIRRARPGLRDQQHALDQQQRGNGEQARDRTSRERRSPGSGRRAAQSSDCQGAQQRGEYRERQRRVSCAGCRCRRQQRRVLAVDVAERRTLPPVPRKPGPETGHGQRDQARDKHTERDRSPAPHARRERRGCAWPDHCDRRRQPADQRHLQGGIPAAPKQEACGRTPRDHPLAPPRHGQQRAGRADQLPDGDGEDRHGPEADHRMSPRALSPSGAIAPARTDEDDRQSRRQVDDIGCPPPQRGDGAAREADPREDSRRIRKAPGQHDDRDGDAQPCRCGG